MSEYDFLLSEEPALKLLPYSKWSAENAPTDSLDSRKNYADYLRSEHLDAGTYDETIERDIREGLFKSSVDKTFITDDDIGREATLTVAAPSLDEQLRSAENTLPADTPEWEAISKYKAFRRTILEQPDAPESYKALGEEYKANAEAALLNTADDVLRMKIRNNEIPFAKVTDADGNQQIIASDSALSIPLKQALLQSKGAGVGLSDALVAKNELEVQEGFSIPRYKLRRVLEASAMLEELAKSDEGISTSIDGYAQRLARTEYDFGDTVGYLADSLGQSITDVVQRIIGKGEEVDKNQALRDKAERVALNDFSTTAESIASKLNSSGALRDSEAFSVDEVQLAMNELGVNAANNKGYFQFHDGPNEIGKNIRSYGFGLPSVAPSLMANKVKFDQALAARSDIDPKIKSQMEGQRKAFIESQFSQFDKLLQRTDVGEDWLNTLQAARANGQKDSTTLESFLSDDKNYSEFSQRAKGIGMSIVDGFGQLLAAVPAVMGADFAQDYLSGVAQKNSDRQELANLFGVDMGVTQEIAEAVAPMLVDMTATTLLAAATAPAAGVGGAAYLAAKQGARLTVKGIVKGITSGALRAGIGETAEVAAKRLVTEGLIKQSVKDAGTKGAMEAIRGYSGTLANKMNIVTTSFIPAANRSMGAAYGTMFNQLLKDPTLTREQAHERALGGALASGAVTGLITSAFAGFGHGGLDTALTRGLTRNEMKTIFSRLTNAADEISDKTFNEVIKKSLKNTFKDFGYSSLSKSIAKNAFDEGTEEALDQFIGSFVQDAALNGNTPMLDRFSQSFHAFVIGGVMGAGVPAIQAVVPSINRDVRNASARNLELKAITDITGRLNESGSPITAQIVSALLTGPTRRRDQMASAIQQKRNEAAAASIVPPVDVTTSAPEVATAAAAAATPIDTTAAPSDTTTAPVVTGAIEPIVAPLAEPIVEPIVAPLVEAVTVESLEEALSKVTPEDVETLIPAVRPEELEATGQMDLGLYVTQTNSERPAAVAPFNMLNFKSIKPVMEQLGLDFNDVVQSELQDLSSSPTIIPRIDLATSSGGTVMLEANPDLFVGDEATVKAEQETFNRIAQTGFPISFQTSVRFGMPKRNVSEKATGQKSYYGTKSNELAGLIYKNYPVTVLAPVEAGSKYASQRKVTFFDAVSGKRVSRQIKGVLDANGNGVFNNDPVLISEMIRDGIPVRIPKKFVGPVNPSLVVRKGYIVDVLGPRADGKAGLVSMTAPIERTLTSEPDYQSLYEASGLASLFIDDITNERVIPSGAPVIDKSGKMLKDGGNETSVGELVTNFNQFVFNATMPEEQQGAAASNERGSLRENASKRIREMLRLRSGSELDSGFFDTALQALHTEYIYHANLFEVRSSLINSGITAETQAGIVIPTTKSKAAVKLLMARLKADSKTTVAERLAPFVNTDAKTISRNPDAVILSFLNSMVLNNPRFDGDVMPTINQLSDTIKARYAEQQKTRGIEERVKASISMDPSIMDKIDIQNLSRSGTYIGEPSTLTSERFSDNEISRVLKQAEFNAINAIDEDADLRDALNDLLFQSVYKNPSANQVSRVVGMTTVDAYGTLANWIASGNFDHPEVLAFERSLRSGEFASGNDLRSALSLSRLSSRASETENPTEDKAFVDAVRNEIGRSLNQTVSIESAKNFIKALDKGIRKRMSRSHITSAQANIARSLNTIEVNKLGIKSGDAQSIIEALKAISKTSKNGNHKLVAELLLEDPAFIKRIKFEIGTADHSIAGEYNRLTDGSHSVFINLNGFNGRGLTNVLLEEYVHAFLSDTLNKPKEALNDAQKMAIARLNGLMELVRQQAESEGITNPSLLDGLENIDEFVASFLLSKKFQALVKSVNPPQGQRGFFGRIIDAMVSLFRKVTNKEKKGYAEALTDILDLSRSAMGAERNTAKALFSSVAGDASDSLERAAAVRDTLPASVIAATAVAPTLSQEEMAIAAVTATQEDANKALVAEQNKVTTANIPQSSVNSDTEQVAKAHLLMRSIRNMIPLEVRLKFITAKEAAQLGDSRRFIASAFGDEISIDMSRLMSYVDGLDNLTSNMLVESVIAEELGHVASYNALTQNQIDSIVDSLSQNELDALANSYYQTDETRQASKDLLRSEDLTESYTEKRRLVEEQLRAHLQRVTTGHSTEENAAFLRTNPSLFKIVLRYIGGAFRRMVGLRSVGNPHMDVALSRMLVEMRALKMGYRNGPASLRFDPNSPAASMEAFRAITGIDDLEEIEAAGFDEDVSEILFSQIGLEDFKRIQRASRPLSEQVADQPTDQPLIKTSEDVPFPLIIESITGSFGLSWKDVSKELINDFETVYKFEEVAGEYRATPIYEMMSLPTISGDPDTPEVVELEAAKAFLNRRLNKTIRNGLAANDIELPELVNNNLVEQFIDTILLDAVDFGNGVQLILNGNADAENEETLITASGDFSELTASNTKPINIDKLKETLFQIDGFELKNESIKFNGNIKFDAIITRGTKKYSMDFDINQNTKNIHVGSLFPINGGEVSGSDSFGMDLLLALISNNHLIGAKTLDTYAAGNAKTVNQETQRNVERRQLAMERGEEYNPDPSMLFKGFKAWPKIGFDTELTRYYLESMADENQESAGIIDEIKQLAADADGKLTLVQLMHLGPDAKRGTVIWSNYGVGSNMVFNLESGSPSMQAFGKMIERAVKLKGTVEEIKPLRQTYARSLKNLESIGLSAEEQKSREQEIRSNFIAGLNKLGVNPDRLLTSLGSGVAFSGKSINFDPLLETLEMPLFEAGTYKAPSGSLLRAFLGELDPRIKRLNDNRMAFNRAATSIVTRYKATLDKLVIARYGAIANAPNDLIAEAMGSTGIEVSEVEYDKIEDEHTARLVAIRNDTALTDDKRSEAILESARLRDAALTDARSLAREAFIRRKDSAITALSSQAPEIAAHIADIRGKLIDPLSMKLKKDYNMTEEFGIHIDSQLGIYMTRAYRMFNEIGFSDRVKQDPKYQDVRDRAIEFFERDFVKQEKRRLQREGILPADAELQAKDALINKRSSTGQSYGQQALMAFIESYNGNSGAPTNIGEGYRVMLNNLKTKKDIPPALRDLLGEYKNSEEGTNNLLRTFVTVASMSSNQSFLNNIRTLGERNGFMVPAEEYHKDPTKYDGFIPFRESTTSKHDPLLGVYAPKEMVEGFQKTFDSNSLRRNTNHAIDIVDSAMGVLNKATGYAMATKTLGSAGFYLRNVLSNMLFFGPAQGFGRIDKMLKVAAEHSWAGLKDQNRIDGYLAELTALDIIGNEIQSNTIRDLINGKAEASGIMKQLDDVMKKTQVSKGKEALSFLVDKAGRLAAAADAVYKIAYFEHELRLLKQAQAASNTGSVTDMSEYQLKRLAAEKVLRTAQSASQAPPIVSEITKSGLGLMFAPFLRFKAEVPRIVINTYKLSVEEMRDDNPKIKTRGMQRFASMTSMLGLVSVVIPSALRVLVSGIDDEEDDALRSSMPEYLRGHTFYYFGSGDKLQSVDLSFINPFSLMVDPSLRAMEDLVHGRVGSAASKFAQGMIFDQYLDDQILAGSVSDLRKNVDATTGEPIWEQDIDGAGSVLSKGLGYILNRAYSPRIVSDAIKAYGAVGGDFSEFDDSPLGLMLSGVYPVRIHDIDLDKQFGRYLREKKEQFDRVTRNKYAAYSERPFTEDSLRELYNDEVANRRSLNQDLVRISRGFEGLGMTPTEIYKNMTTRGGISKRRAGLLFNNLMDRPDLNKGFLQGLLQREFGMERAKVLIDQMENHPRYMFVE
jgi:hypothetical protein